MQTTGLCAGPVLATSYVGGAELFEVFYDGECPLCMREIRMLRRMDRRGRIRFTDIAAPGLDASPLDSAFFLPERTGIIVADRYAGAILRTAPSHALSGARRKAETLRFARRAAARLLGAIDPELALPETG